MKVAVEKINHKAIEVKEDILADSWNMNSPDVTFVDNIHIDCEFIKVVKAIALKAKVTTHRKINCSRCLGDAYQTVSQDVVRNYNIDNLGEYLDVDNDIREEILLNFPMKVLCKADCKGLCPGCGVNLNCQRCRCQK